MKNKLFLHMLSELLVYKLVFFYMDLLTLELILYMSNNEGNTFGQNLWLNLEQRMVPFSQSFTNID